MCFKIGAVNVIYTGDKILKNTGCKNVNALNFIFFKTQGCIAVCNIYTLPKNDTPCYYIDQYETKYLWDGFLGIQNAAMALTRGDHNNEDWRFPKM